MSPLPLKTYDLQPLVQNIARIVDSHRLDQTGAYRRWVHQDPAWPRDFSVNPYGCADAANILYTINAFPSAPADREQWIAMLRQFQCVESGMFREATHHEIHTTAHCIAALELFDAAPTHALKALAPYRSPAAMIDLLERLRWRDDPWGNSHQGAGLYASLVLAREVTSEWKDAYFDWLFENSDPASGLLRQGCIGPVETVHGASVFPHLAGTFHYLFNQQSDHRPLRYPAALVDTCLELITNRTYPLGASVSFAEIDWVYCLTRALRQSHHRHEEARRALEAFSGEYLPFLLALDPETHDGLNDLHMLFGAVCCVAELQAALPGKVRTERPMRLVLDRRPFI